VKERISKRISDHAVANTWWNEKLLPSWLTEECYVQRLQPLLRSKKVREIAEVMGVSQPYATLIRSGRRRPHARHWLALGALVNVRERLILDQRASRGEKRHKAPHPTKTDKDDP
jgi:transcriptional regulator with XRE-family HTH domain